MTHNAPWLRFAFNEWKCIDAIHYITTLKPGITQYHVSKVFFFADREHLKDWGRPISGDRYVAMEHGPVPSNIYDILKLNDGLPEEVVAYFSERIDQKKQGNLIHCFPKKDAQFASKYLSETDKKYLENALDNYGSKGFGEIKTESHKDVAYEKAWTAPGLNNEMDLRLWFTESELEEIYENGPVLRRA